MTTATRAPSHKTKNIRSASIVPCPGCLGSGMSSRVMDDQGGPERCEACAGVGSWTAAEMAAYESWLAGLDRAGRSAN